MPNDPIRLDPSLALGNLVMKPVIDLLPSRLGPQEPAAGTPVATGGEQMPAPGAIQESAVTASGRRMPRLTRAPLRPAGAGDQVEIRGPKVTKPSGYLAIRMSVVDGVLRVDSAKAVEGPLATEQSLPEGLAWEVTRDKERIAHGSVPSMLERRSFPPPTPTPGQVGHHVSPMPMQSFTVRVPIEELSLADLPKVSVRLFRLKSSLDVVKPGVTPLDLAHPAEVRALVALDGIDVAPLGPAASALRRRR